MHTTAAPSRLRRLTALAIVATALLASTATAQSLQIRLETLIQSADFGDAVCAVSVVNLADGIAVAAYQQDQSLIPASNMKLVTSAAALGVLGPDFHFTTQMQRHGNDLVIVSDGDPAFGDQQLLRDMGMKLEDMLARWADAAQKAGITHVETLVVDARSFDTQRVHPSWPITDLTKPYAAQVAGINFNNNCVDILGYYTRAGQSPEIRTRPVNAPVIITNDARSGTRNEMQLDRELGTNRITVKGQVARTRASAGFMPVHDPALFFGRVLRDRLKDRGITVGDVRHATDDDHYETGGQLIAEVKTPLAAVLARCNKDSENLFAEALIKRVGRKATGDPGTWPAGAAAERMFLSRLLGPRAAGFVIDDGSGLSRNNRVTAELLTALLFEMDKHPRFSDSFRQSLSIAGEDGTLRHRFGAKSFTSEVYGKSGFVRGVVALTGYIERGEDRLAFSIILNNYPRSNTQGKREIDKLIYAIDDFLAGRRMDLDTGKTTAATAN